ncbi:MAG: nodulation protein NodZ [Cyanobacteriota bacterium]|jgi:hypothetical protein
MSEPFPGQPSDPRLVVIKSSGGGGLGDSIRTLVAGIDYAVRSDRWLHVDWSDGLYGPVGENVFPSLFELQDLPYLASLSGQLGRSDVHPPAWQGHLDLSMKELWGRQFTSWDRQQARGHFSFDQQDDSLPQGVLVMWDFDSFFARSQAFAKARSLLHRHLQPAAAIRAEVDHFLAEQGNDGPLVGLHIRHSREALAGGKGVASDLLLRKARQLASENPRTRFLICTDNADKLEEFQQLLPRTVVRPKPLPPAGEAIHLVDFGPSALAKTRDALIEMLLLARCDALIYPAQSSFSLCSALWSDLPPQHLHPVAATPTGRSERVLRPIRAAVHRLRRALP